MINQDRKDTRYLLILILIFVLLSAGIIAAGYRYYSNYAVNYRAQVENQLASIAELKTEELMHWRQERLGDAGFFYKNPAFSALVQRYFENADDVEAEGQLRAWLDHALESCPYERVILMDTGYAGKMVSPRGTEQSASFVSPGTAAMLQSGQIAFEDFYFDDVSRKIFLNVIVPILDPDDDSRLIGFLALHIDPEQYLYPMINRWPTPSATAETLIVRRDGNDVLYLNELRFQKDSALKLRIPLEREEIPAVMGVTGFEGIMEGRDYRDAEVIAAVQSIPGSPWTLVARMDTSEVYAPMTQMLWIITLLAGTLLIGAGAGVGLLWRQKGLNFYRQRIEVMGALQESETKYRRIVETAIEGIVGLDRDARMTFVNQQFASMLGYTVEELLGQKFESYMAEEELEDHYAQMRLRATGKGAAYERHFRRKDGRALWTIISAQVIYDSGGRREGSFAMLTDITERKHAEATLKQAFEDLERFTYTISHDLKSPLVTIKTFLGYLKQDITGADAGKVGKDMFFMEGAADKMSRLLDELLEMSRIGRIVNPPITVTFGEVVQEALDLLAGGIREHGVETAVSGETVRLHGDRPRLVEIWQNLIENAVKFMGEQAAPRIDIGVEQRGRDTVFFVRDNGMGIDPRHKSRVFNLFDKLDTKSEGTGLGLAIVKRIVEMYKGTVWFESAGAGQGSCFFFTLPAALKNKGKGERK